MLFFLCRSLRRTTAEIQNYSFEALGSGKLLDRDRDTTSQDSGISQMSAGAGDKMDTLEERMEDMSITRNNSVRSPVGYTSLWKYRLIPFLMHV
jgi:CLIP-associating protein 1/2